jgi:hypothetical protein
VHHKETLQAVEGIAPKTEHILPLCALLRTSRYLFEICIFGSNLKLNEHSKKVIFINFSHLVKTGNDHTSIISENAKEGSL